MRHRTSFYKGAFLIAIAAALTISACKHTDNNNTLSNPDDNGGYASDQAKMETNSSDVISMADAAAKMSSGSSGEFRTSATTIGGCASVYDSIVGTDSFLVINFGTTDCTCLDFKNRRGEIIIQYNGRYKDSTSQRTITYNNYFVNDNQLTGIKTVTNMGANSSGQVYYNVTVNDTLNLGAGNGEITWTGNRTRTWLAGYGTGTWTDDEYLIGGVTTLVRANGHSFTFTIDASNQLQVATTCPYIEAGIVTITGSTLSEPRTLNYGSGACDNEATLTIGSHTYNITL